MSDMFSLSGKRALITDPDIRNFTLITAYRENEIGAAHPVTDLFADLASAGLGGEVVDVGPMARPDIAAMKRRGYPLAVFAPEAYFNAEEFEVGTKLPHRSPGFHLAPNQ